MAVCIRENVSRNYFELLQLEQKTSQRPVCNVYTEGKNDRKLISSLLK